MTDATALTRRVATWLSFETDDQTALALQVAVATKAVAIETEALTISLDGQPVEPVELTNDGGERIHVVDVDAGTLRVAYEATVRPPSESHVEDRESMAPIVADRGAIEALYPSAYCRSDRLAGFAAMEFGSHRGEPDLAQRVAGWVFDRVAYEPGSSGPLDAAIDTLLTNTGVCRDFAHLTTALLRALGVPARLTAVYAPGLTPMDFHAVVEARTATGWEVVDPTRLAPRSSLVRIATGRDAADTAFATTIRGNAELITQEVFAVVDGNLPADDHVTPTVLT